MNYIKFILVTSLALSSFSAHAEEAKQELAKKILSHAGSAAKTTGRVAKVGVYGALTGVSGVAIAIPVGLLVLLNFMCSKGLAEIYCSEQEVFSLRETYTIFDGEYSRKKALAAPTVVLIAGTATFTASVYGMVKLTTYFAQKTKQAAQEAIAQSK